MILQCIVWPETTFDCDDSEEEITTESIVLISGFFRIFVEEGMMIGIHPSVYLQLKSDIYIHLTERHKKNVFAVEH